LGDSVGTALRNVSRAASAVPRQSTSERFVGDSAGKRRGAWRSSRKSITLGGRPLRNSHFHLGRSPWGRADDACWICQVHRWQNGEMEKMIRAADLKAD